VLEEEQAAEYTFGISASWEIGARGSRAEARIAKNGVESSKLDIETVERAKAKKLRDLGDRLEEALRLVHLQEQSVELGEFQHALYKDRWENGDIDILEYVRSQNDLENSKIQLINSKTSYMELLGEYDYETGR
jgi:outer membrane protein TolC